MILDSQRTMNFFDNRYYKLNRELLWFIGLWPYQDPKARRVRTTIVNVFLIFTILPQILNMFTSEFNMSLLLKNFMFFLPCLCIIVIYYTAYVSKNELKLFTDRIVCDWNKLNHEELKIVKKYANQSRILTRVLIYSFYAPVTVILFYSAIPIILQDIKSTNNNYTHELIYPIELIIINKNKNPYVILIFSNIIILFIGIISLANYTFFIICIQHTCAIFRVSGYILEHIIDEKEKDLSQFIDSKEIYYKLIRGINYHKMAIEYTGIINSFAEICYLLQIIMTLLILAADIMGLMQATMKSFSMTIICALHISSMIIWTLFNCIIGQRILDHSHIVFDKICMVPWYLFEPKIQKLSIMILMRSTKPSYLSIGKLFVSTHTFFSSLLQSSVSYGMLLRSFS